jgi:hypothetical protein
MSHGCTRGAREARGWQCAERHLSFRLGALARRDARQAIGDRCNSRYTCVSDTGCSAIDRSPPGRTGVRGPRRSSASSGAAWSVRRIRVRRCRRRPARVRSSRKATSASAIADAASARLASDWSRAMERTTSCVASSSLALRARTYACRSSSCNSNDATRGSSSGSPATWIVSTTTTVSTGVGPAGGGTTSRTPRRRARHRRRVRTATGSERAWPQGVVAGPQDG